MFKIRNILIGGIETKIIALVTACILLVAGLFTGADIYKSKKSEHLLENMKNQQLDSMSEYSNEMIEEIVTKEMTHAAELEALVTDASFNNLKSRVTFLADYAEKLLSNPENYAEVPWQRPKHSMVNQLNTIFMLPDGVDETDPVISARMGLLANMSEMMISLCDATGAENAYVSTPEGIHIATSRNASSWFKDDRTLKSFDPRERYWYQEAVAAGKLIFTDVGDDRETGKLCIVCAMPVYDKNGELLAVAGSDFFLTEIQEAVESSGGDTEFQVITNQTGQVIFSPKKEGEFKAPGKSVYGEDYTAEKLQTIDLRQSDNKELAAFLNDIMRGKTETRSIKLSDGEYYIAGSSIPSIGWTQISVFSKDKAYETMLSMMNRYNDIHEEAEHNLSDKMNQTSLIMALILIAEIALLYFVAKRQGHYIVEPLNHITKRISEISGEDREFRMEDAYRTGDEIEVLAEAFAKLSHDSKMYVEQVKTATAERERMSTELHMANRIQESMLPSTFPAFPDCSSVDIYASMTPAKEVGGDFYDFFFIDPDHLVMVIADVSGKGVPAALFMMISRTIIKNCAMLKKSPAEILEEANKALCSENIMEMFVTVWIGILELSTGVVKTANAGHEHPVIYSSHDGTFELRKEKHDFVMGGMEDMTYREKEIILYPGDKLFVYTDGVPEAENVRQEFFGTDRMVEALNRSSSGTPKEILTSVREAIDTFVGTAEQFDDLTMLCVEYKGV